jgi:Zn-dependent protease with chaperone function
MEYHNRQPSEGINVSRLHPLLLFVKLLVLGLVIFGVLAVVLNYSGAYLARKIPFEYETAVMQQIDAPLGDNNHRVSDYLSALVSALSNHMEIPASLTFTVHYNDDSVFNAFATIGGNLVFYRGLLERMPDENTLAMVVAHEMAHVIHRDPVAGLGGGLSSMLAVMMLGGASGAGMAADVIGSAGTLTNLSFSRAMEVSADQTALAALAGYYGHVGGADHLFRLFAQARNGTDSDTDAVESDWLSEFSSTHPLDASRIEAVNRQAKANDWPQEGPRTPLPADFHDWL